MLESTQDDMIMYLTEQMNGSNRFYHNLHHITYMFNKAREYKMLLTLPEVWAIWFHDIVYVPGSENNEEQSADLAAIYAAKFTEISINDIGLIKKYIRMTHDHKPVFAGLTNNVIDLDLAALGKDSDSYMVDNKNIEHEYLQIVTVEEWRRGRQEFIIEFLKRDKIFHDAKMYWDLEKQARSNLKKELKLFKLQEI